MHKIGLFLTKIEVISNAMAHLSSPKNLSNEHTAPAYWELGKPERKFNGKASLSLYYSIAIKRNILGAQGQNLTITFSEVAHFTITFSEFKITLRVHYD